MATKTYTVERSRTIAAEPRKIRPFIVDFRRWREWSPWEGLDDDLHRAYSGPPTGVGSRYAWNGNRKAGAGSMEILSSESEQVDVALEFLKPFKSRTTISFLICPLAEGRTEVTWRMVGSQTLLTRLMPIERLVGRDFEKGLASLDEAARTNPD